MKLIVWVTAAGVNVSVAVVEPPGVPYFGISAAGMAVQVAGFAGSHVDTTIVHVYAEPPAAPLTVKF